MTTPTFPTAVPSTQDPSSGNGFGPDFTKTEEAQRPPTGAKPSDTKEKRSTPFGTLGANKKTRSPVRKLSDEDKQRMYAWYMRLAALTMTFHPKLSTALQMQAEDCVNTWCDLAENNDNVRRKILAFIEGGDWGKVIMAHAPIFLAVIPESMIEKVMTGSLFAAMFRNDEPEPEPEPDVMYPADLNNVPPFVRREPKAG